MPKQNVVFATVLKYCPHFHRLKTRYDLMQTLYHPGLRSTTVKAFASQKRYF